MAASPTHFFTLKCTESERLYNVYRNKNTAIVAAASVASPCPIVYVGGVNNNNNDTKNNKINTLHNWPRRVIDDGVAVTKNVSTIIIIITIIIITINHGARCIIHTRTHGDRLD